MEYTLTIKEDSTEEIQSILESCLADTTIKSENKDNGVIVAAEKENTTLGFAAGYISDEAYKAITPLSTDRTIKSYIEKVCVAEEFRNNGIGTALNEALIEQLQKPILVDAWIKPGKPDLVSTYEKLGFNRIETFENRWKERSLNNPDYVCLECGDICTCASAAYILEKND